MLGVGGEALAEHEVDRAAATACRRPRRARAGPARRPPASHSESPTSWPWAVKNGKHIAPPMRIVVGELEERLEDADLVGHLGAADDRDERARRVGEDRPAASRPRAAAAARRRWAAAARRRRSRRARGARRRTRRRRRRRRAPRSAWRAPGRPSSRPARSGRSRASRRRRRGRWSRSGASGTSVAEQLRQPRCATGRSDSSGSRPFGRPRWRRAAAARRGRAARPASAARRGSACRR